MGDAAINVLSLELWKINK